MKWSLYRKLNDEFMQENILLNLTQKREHTTTYNQTDKDDSGIHVVVTKTIYYTISS